MLAGALLIRCKEDPFLLRKSRKLSCKSSQLLNVFMNLKAENVIFYVLSLLSLLFCLSSIFSLPFLLSPFSSLSPSPLFFPPSLLSLPPPILI